MRSIIRIAAMLLVLIPAMSFAQTTKATTWPEMKAFHTIMAATFHPAEEGNFAPLKQKSDTLVMAAKAWIGSSVPSNYKPMETQAELKKLYAKTVEVNAAVKASASDDQLKKLISEAHDIFHKIVGECKKADGE